MSIVTVTSKGQIAIPARTRKRMGITRGTRLYVEERDGEIVMKPITEAYLEQTAGILKDGPELTEMLLAERGKDRAGE